MLTVQTIDTKAQSKGFWDTLEIWLRKPHVINRRLCGSRILWQQDFNVKPENDEDTILAAIEELKSEGCVFEKPDDITSVLDGKVSESLLNTKKLKVYLRELLPRQIQRFSILRELIIYDDESNHATYIPVRHMTHDGTPYQCHTESEDIDTGDITYRVKFDAVNSSISIQVNNADLVPSKHSLACSAAWLTGTLLPKLARWGGQEVLNTAVSSLKLVPVDRYNQLYQDLKAKYGPQLVEMWPERTDPQKFVYEDIAIAAYLLILWEDDREKKGLAQKQSFVDIGCGNGLLVHLLTSEGHPGVGLDVRKRKIWDLYGKDTKLKEEPINPSDETVFPNSDWLIGNHSDELTPWIPVMAARSSYHCNYFVLPCCPWDFVGKFRHKEQGVSQYRSYLNYIRALGEKCGFEVEEDTLRIPSTKRSCFIGRSRTYSLDAEPEADSVRKNFIQERCQSHLKNNITTHTTQNKRLPVDSETDTSCESPSDASGTNRTSETACCHGDTDSAANEMHGNSTANTSSWAVNFQPREQVEEVRNCVNLDNDLKNRMIKTVFEKLLNAPDAEMLALDGGQHWNRGGNMPLAEVAQLFDQSTLQQLKCECGGLQTLLRNAHFVFLVRGGTVQLRDWTNDDHMTHQVAKKKRKGHLGKVDTSHKTKTRICFFFENHPDGCPLSASACRFAHGEDEMRTFKPLEQQQSKEKKL